MAAVLVDGENVRRSVWPNIDRTELERLASAWAQANGHDVVVVWESQESADDRIVREARAHTDHVWVVTSDRELRERLHGHVQRTIGGGTFARELAAQRW
jgi:predicted RNA-binding protein with PIN domain